jgi:DNA invertase Pin-like site-specific DNA recombinase
MKETNKKLGNCVIYTRVSTKEQQENGHSLKEQQELCQSYVLGHGGKVLAVYSDVVSGKSQKRAKLDLAVSLAIQEDAKLIFWDIDRMGRHEATCHRIKDKIQFKNLIFINNPNVDEFAFSIRLSMGADEARKISQRTKVGQAGARRAGKTIGREKGCEHSKNALEASIASRKEISKTMNIQAKNIIEVELKTGKSYQAIAKQLNAYQIKTAKGGLWSATQISRLVKMYDLKK